VRLRSFLVCAPLFAAATSGVLVASFEGCSLQGTALTDGGGIDGAADAPFDAIATDAGGGDADASLPPDSASPVDGATRDGSLVDSGMRDADASPPFVTDLAITSPDGGGLVGAPGDAIPLVVVLTMSDGTTRQASANQILWGMPGTVVAEDPFDAGANAIPEAGTEPTAFYVENGLRPELPSGLLFILDRGTTSSPRVTVTASIADAGDASAIVSILAPADGGDPDAGAYLFQHVLLCKGCHGATGNGSPPELLPDGGLLLRDGGPVFLLGGQEYSYPAPGLNAAAGHVAADPEWNVALFAVAAQSGMDNYGVALRAPMPIWAGVSNGMGHPLDAQNFADIYAWMKTQTQ
jgi:hypothetical protein